MGVAHALPDLIGEGLTAVGPRLPGGKGSLDLVGRRVAANAERGVEVGGLGGHKKGLVVSG